MEDTANSLNAKARILISRNRPVALVAGACSFLGSHVVDYLLTKNIQVIGVGDISTSRKKNLSEAGKNKDFHLINLPIESPEISRSVSVLDAKFDYGFFVTDLNTTDAAISLGIINFIELAKLSKEGEQGLSKPRLAFISSINLYARKLDKRDRVLKEAESKFARCVKQFKLNGRIIRLAEMFGPRMEFNLESPISRLIIATVNDSLEKEITSLDFTERSLFVGDAVKLLIKSVLSGSTANKIYDGALLHPLKVSEIKQILSDPVWYENNNPEITKLPAWPTPNLIKTIKELSWQSKTPILKALRETIAYFKENSKLLPEAETKRKPLAETGKDWSFAGTGFLGAEREENKATKETKVSEGLRVSSEVGKKFDNQFEDDRRKSVFGKTKSLFWITVLVSIIVYGLVWPFIYLGYEGLKVREHLLSSKSLLEIGNFSQAEAEIRLAQNSLGGVKQFLNGFPIIERIPGIKTQAVKFERLVDLADEGVGGILYATTGSRSLFETTKIISGESREDPTPYYEKAQADLGNSTTKLSKAYIALSDPAFIKDFPEFLKPRIEELTGKIFYYLNLVDQTKTAANLMPKLTGIGGKRSYLVLLQNNLELRSGGGFIGSYAKLDFENGRLVKINVDDIYNLDGALKETISPPVELKNDLGIERLFLRDSNYEPDFPTSAKLASFFYKKEAFEPVHGVIAMDLKASGNLLDAVSGIDLPEYGEFVNGANLFERAITHAEANFFPGSQAKKNYLTSLQNQLFNKIFYLSKQNWPAIIQAISKSLQEKHILVYLEDPELFSYLASSNWSGVFPRGIENREGETNNFLAVIESNMGANKVNYYLQRKYNLESSFTKEGKIINELKISYKNTSPSNAFPGGTYKSRVKIYVPLGTKIINSSFGEEEITTKWLPFSDYGRTGFSTLLQVLPKEQKVLAFNYELPGLLNFKDNKVIYKMEIFKQPGTMQDPLDFKLTYPINFKVEDKSKKGSSGVQEIKIVTDLQTDRVFQFTIKK